MLVLDLITLSSVPHGLTSTDYTFTAAAEASSSYYLERAIPVLELFLLSLALDFSDLKGLVCISWASYAL